MRRALIKLIPILPVDRGHKKLKRRVGRDPGGQDEVFPAAAGLDTR